MSVYDRWHKTHLSPAMSLAANIAGAAPSSTPPLITAREIAGKFAGATRPDSSANETSPDAMASEHHSTWLLGR